MNYSTAQISEAGRKAPPRRIENQDRVLCRELKVGDVAGLLLVVADGISRCPSGGSVANWLVANHLAEDPIDFPSGTEPVWALKSYLDHLSVQFRDEFAAPEFEGMLRSGCTLSVVLVHGRQADCLWAGDSPVYHSRPVKKGFETQLLTRPDHDREGCLTNCFGAYSHFALHHCRVQLEDSDIVTLASDGIAVDDYTLGRIYKDQGFGPLALQEMLRISRRGKFWDDLSVAAAKATPA